MEVTWLAALTAGVLSFVSPCVLPLVPAYLSYMTGVSVDALREGERSHNREVMRRTLGYSLAFVAGFSLIFVVLGASASLVGRLMLANMDWLAKVGGAVIVAMGIHYTGWSRLSWLNNLNAQFQLRRLPAGWLGAFVMGLAFAFGWTPCVGPILAAILAKAGMQQSVGEGIGLLVVYSAGLGIPFLLASWSINTFLAFFARMRRHLHKVEVFSGILLILIGLSIFFGSFSRFGTLLIEWFPGLIELG